MNNYYKSYYSHRIHIMVTWHKLHQKKRSSAKYDVVIKAKATTTRIVDISNQIVRFESNDKGQVTGKHYSDVHWDTVESTMLADGSASLTIRYLHMTNKGESLPELELALRWFQTKEELQKLLAREQCGHLL
jgi:hypothetical protein